MFCFVLKIKKCIYFQFNGKQNNCTFYFYFNFKTKSKVNKFMSF